MRTGSCTIKCYHISILLLHIYKIFSHIDKTMNVELLSFQAFSSLWYLDRCVVAVLCFVVLWCYIELCSAGAEGGSGVGS